MKEKVEKPKEMNVVKPKKVEKGPEIREIVRVMGADLDGSKPLRRSLTKIKGISHSFCKAVCYASGYDPDMKLGSLTESDIQKLENVIRNPIKFGIYNWFLNRRKDTDTGQDLHLSGPDLEVVRRFDIQKMIDMKSYKGIRHMLGLPVRGQRTRSGFRKGRVVGVVRKTIRVLQEKGKEKKEEKK